MSVLIKGLKMPRNCAECPFLYDGNACYAVNEPDAMFLPLVCNGRTDEYPINKFPFHEKRVDWCPLVDAEPVRHGKWITEECLPGVAVCSICGHEIRGIGCQYTKYCDECGARMDKE